MSTAHTGGFCPVKDKMQLSRADAKGIVIRMRGTMYYCEHCASWHISSGRQRIRRLKQLASAKKQSRWADPYGLGPPKPRRRKRFK